MNAKLTKPAQNLQEQEEWRDIKGYEGLYQVSNKGRVKSLERAIAAKSGSKRTIRERVLKLTTNPKGYLRVQLYNSSGKMKIFSVHRLVCEAFYPNPQNKPQVNHINEVKTDNRACNLEWVTAKENLKHGTRPVKIAKANVKNKSKSVGQYTLDGELIKIWQSTMEVQRQLGFAPSHISLVARGKRETAYGYVWKYVEDGK